MSKCLLALLACALFITLVSACSKNDDGRSVGLVKPGGGGAKPGQGKVVPLAPLKNEAQWGLMLQELNRLQLLVAKANQPPTQVILRGCVKEVPSKTDSPFLRTEYDCDLKTPIPEENNYLEVHTAGRELFLRNNRNAPVTINSTLTLKGERTNPKNLAFYFDLGRKTTLTNIGTALGDVSTTEYMMESTAEQRDTDPSQLELSETWVTKVAGDWRVETQILNASAESNSQKITLLKNGSINLLYKAPQTQTAKDRPSLFWNLKAENDIVFSGGACPHPVGAFGVYQNATRVDRIVSSEIGWAQESTATRHDWPTSCYGEQ
jgi:hypothetical protein